MSFISLLDSCSSHGSRREPSRQWEAIAKITSGALAPGTPRHLGHLTDGVESTGSLGKGTFGVKFTACSRDLVPFIDVISTRIWQVSVFRIG